MAPITTDTIAARRLVAAWLREDQMPTDTLPLWLWIAPVLAASWIVVGLYALMRWRNEELALSRRQREQREAITRARMELASRLRSRDESSRRGREPSIRYNE